MILQDIFLKIHRRLLCIVIKNSIQIYGLLLSICLIFSIVAYLCFAIAPLRCTRVEVHLNYSNLLSCLRVRAIITRKDLMGFHMEERIHKCLQNSHQAQETQSPSSSSGQGQAQRLEAVLVNFRVDRQDQTFRVWFAFAWTNKSTAR